MGVYLFSALLPLNYVKKLIKFNILQRLDMNPLHSDDKNLDGL